MEAQSAGPSCCAQLFECTCLHIPTLNPCQQPWALLRNCSRPHFSTLSFCFSCSTFCEPLICAPSLRLAPLNLWQAARRHDGDSQEERWDHADRGSVLRAVTCLTSCKVKPQCPHLKNESGNIVFPHQGVVQIQSETLYEALCPLAVKCMSVSDDGCWCLSWLRPD